MKNKGFTLVEILAVIVIIGLLVTMATLGITRIRKNADTKDRINLHSSLQTSFENFRTVLVTRGDYDVDKISIDGEMPSDFEKYITDLSYNGHRLSKTDLEGSLIRLYQKGYVLYNDQYTLDIIGNNPNFESLTDDQKYDYIEEQYIKDATCIVESKVVNPGQSGSTIEKYCKTFQHDNYVNYAAENIPKLLTTTSPYTSLPVEPSKDEIICLKIKYKGETVIDDWGTEPNALQVNKLCRYMDDNRIFK